MSHCQAALLVIHCSVTSLCHFSNGKMFPSKDGGFSLYNKGYGHTMQLLMFILLKQLISEEMDSNDCLNLHSIPRELWEKLVFCDFCNISMILLLKRYEIFCSRF